MKQNLTYNQIEAAKQWYNEHHEFVDRIISGERVMYPPSEEEDKNNPQIWKPEYWKWFLTQNNI